ncbi:hypothetical protein RKE29_06600 [Streptomyces sp. B1866]|uniref:hypothetical protein n=1 Tax=Streptomyces sp. B1866 TaxID=3075431 RepID=UPI0028908E4C|nr:hypothetical protein [Streptomyces sp. B1866]MDT3396311.1 hypothetical protein [Streptomyces sp. B1866]
MTVMERAGGLVATGHPLQRAGAWAVAVMAGRELPEQVGADDLNGVADTVVRDAVAAAVAAKTDPCYDWWKVLFALYPNSKATHASRPRDAVVLRDALAEMFVPDDPAGRVLPCTFCGADAAAVWAKSTLPMFDSNKALNTLPPGVQGWPVCRGCRVAMWALPYGAWVTAGSATVLSCESRQAEREFAVRNVRRARRIIQAGFTSLSTGASPELVVLRALRNVGRELSATTLWSFKNDNQEPWLRVTRTRRAVPVFLAAVDGNAPLRRGWRLMEIAFTQRDGDGRVTAAGPVEAARLLFEAEDGRSRSLLGQLHRLLWETERWSSQDRAALTRLAFAYEKEIHGVEPDLSGVANLIATWIEHGSGSPRGRLAQYGKAALDGYRLGLLLHQASLRLRYDGRPVHVGSDEARPFVQQRPRAWEQRVLLSLEVQRLLDERGVAVNARPEDPREREQIERLIQEPPLDLMDDDDEFGAV